MARPPSRLILSFIGKADLKYIQPQGDDKSPIMRLIEALLDADSEVQRPQYIQPQQTRLVLLDDDREGYTERAQFCEQLRTQLPGLEMSELTLERQPVALSAPNDLEALYEHIWSIPTSGTSRTNEVIFHLTSGTPSMQVTFLLASQSLRLENARLFETSRQQGVREVTPPYALALRKTRERERVAYHGQALTLKDGARKTLIPDTVLDDVQVASAYAALYQTATQRKRAPRVLICGPVGCGKWHACQQFARWYEEDDPVIWLDPLAPPELPEGATVLIRWLDTWTDSAQHELIQLQDQRPDVAIAATWRTGVAPLGTAAASGGRSGLRGAARIDLPALGVRTDVVALAEALARQLGLTDGKLKERLQYDLLDERERYPHDLHDFKTFLATAGAYSTTKHPQRAAYVRARDLVETQALLDEALRVVAEMDFGPKRHQLDQVTDVIRAAMVRQALAQGRNQKEAGALLGFSQQTVSEILKAELNLQGWAAAGHKTP